MGRCNQCNPKCNYKNKTNYSYCHPEFISGSIQNPSHTQNWQDAETRLALNGYAYAFIPCSACSALHFNRHLPQIHPSQHPRKGLYGLDYIVSIKVREVSSKLDTEPIYANKINYICFILRCPLIVNNPNTR